MVKGLFYEAKKMMIYQKGLIIILVFLTLSGLILFFTDKPLNYETKNYKSEYTYYLNKMNGKCTPEKEAYIKNEAKRVSEAKTTIEKLYNDYYDEKIEKFNFETELNNLLLMTKNDKGFEELHKQYVYVRENTKNRYFLDTNGWNGLIANDGLDLMLVIVVILLITPVFCNEYSSKMNSLALTSKNGEKNYILYKLLLSVIVIALICVTSFITRYAFYDIKYGLLNGEYPLQSLSYFSTSTKNISLLCGYFAICGLKLLGYIFFTVFILFTSVIIKKYSLSIFISIALIIIPYIGLDNVKKYIFPIPLSLMLATGFFKGNQYKKDLYTEEVISTFKEPSQIVLLFLFLTCIVVILFFISFIKHKNKNMWNIKTSQKIKITSLILCCLFSLNLSGCTNVNQIANKNYNLQSKNVYQTDTFKCFVDSTKSEIILEDKQTRKQELLVRNPLHFQTKEASMIFGSGNFIYYIKHNMKEVSLNMGEACDSVAVVELNTKTFKEKIIFERALNVNNDSELSVGNYRNDKWRFLSAIQGFFLDENYIYFINKDIKQVDRVTGTIKVIDVNTVPSISFDGENIYNLGKRSVLSKYNIARKEYSDITNVIATRFLLEGQTIVYINRLDNYKLYCYNLDNEQTKKIYDNTVDYFDFDGEYIVVTDKSNLEEHRLNWNSIEK